MQLEKKKSHNNINNKNIVNVIINTSKTKSGKSKKNSYSKSSYESPNVSTTGFNSSVNLQHEILRQSLNPQINRPSNPSNKIRDDETAFIDEGSALPRVDLGENFDTIFSSPKPKPIKIKKLPNRSTKQERIALLEDYLRMGGNDPLILNSTRKKTIQNAIKQLPLMNIKV